MQLSPQELRSIQLVEMDLLKKFISVCKKYDLTYYASSGTLLGAARHQGFIPWDDDIDLFLMWNDYKKLMEVAPNEFQFPYFFQSHHTESEGEASACRLRRTDTTGCTKWEREKISDPNYNRGIFIDIFPLFDVPNSIFLRKIQKRVIMFWWKCIRGHDALREKTVQGAITGYEQYIRYYKALSYFVRVEKMKDYYLAACAFHGFSKNIKEVGATSSRVHQQNLMWDKAYYRGTISLPFEDIRIDCPIQYKEVLTKQYGDWRVPKTNGARHEMELFSTEFSYKTIFSE